MCRCAAAVGNRGGGRGWDGTMYATQVAPVVADDQENLLWSLQKSSTAQIFAAHPHADLVNPTLPTPKRF